MREKRVEKRHLGYEMEMMARQDMKDDGDMRPGGWQGIQSQLLACVSNMDCEEAAGRVCNNSLCGCNTGKDCRHGAVCQEGECM